MGRHIVRKKGLKYTFLDDKSYDLFVNGLAYFDDRQDFRNSSDHKFCKGCRKPLVEADDSYHVSTKIERTYTPPSVGEQIKNEIIYKVSDRIADYLTNDVIVPLFRDKAVPKIKEIYDVVTGKTTPKVDMVVKESKSATISKAATDKKKAKSNEHSQNETLYRVFISYLGLIDALNDLKESDPELAKKIISTLGNSDTIKKVNVYLQSHPDFLQANENAISLSLGRKLVQNGVYIPFQLEEINEHLNRLKME